VARRFESGTGDANEPSDISILKSGQYGGNGIFSKYMPPLFSDPGPRAISWPFRYQHFAQLCAERITSAVMSVDNPAGGAVTGDQPAGGAVNAFLTLPVVTKS
jgi:hypothetical protein